MAKKIENLTLRAVEHLAGDDHGEYVGDDLFMAMSDERPQVWQAVSPDRPALSGG